MDLEFLFSKKGIILLFVLLSSGVKGQFYYSTGNGSAYATQSWALHEDGTGGNPTLTQLSNGTISLVVQDGHTITLDNNGDIDVYSLAVGEGASGVFVIGEDATQRILTIRETLNINTGGVFQSGSSGAPAHKLKIYGTGGIQNNGTIDLHQSHTSVVNTEVYGDITFEGIVAPVFYDLTFKTGSNAVANVSLNVDNNLTLESEAAFNDGGNTTTITNSWINTGGTFTTSGAVHFDGETSSISPSGFTTTFNNLNFIGGGITCVNENVVVNGNVLISNNTGVSVDNVSVTVNGDFLLDSGAEYTQVANSINFGSADAQIITLNGKNSFYRVYFSNGGAVAKTVVGDMDVTEWLMINSGATAEGTGNYTINGGLRLDGTCNFSGKITMKGGVIDTNLASVNSISPGTADLYIEGGVYLRHNVVGEYVTVDVQGDVVVRDNGYLIINDDAFLKGGTSNTLTLGSGRSLYIRGADNFPNDFVYDFDDASYVRYDANMAQVIRGNIDYGALYLRYAHNKTADGPININGSLYFYDAAVLDLANYSHTFSGSYVSNGVQNGSIDGANATFTIGGGDYNQTFDQNGTGIYTFGNLILNQDNASATRTQTFNDGCNIVVTGDMTVNNVGGSEAIQHIVNLNANPITGSAGTLSLGAFCQLNVDHLNVSADVMDNFSNISFDENSTVYYSLHGGDPLNPRNPIDPLKNQYIADGVTYGNLVLYYGNKIAEGNLDINGDVRRIGNCVFYDTNPDDAGASYSHTVAGDWQLNSSISYTKTTAQGTITFDGADQDINGVNFNHVVIASSGSANVYNNLVLFGDLFVNNGSAFNVSTLGITIAGDITVNGTGAYLQTTGVTTLNGSLDQNVTLSSGSTLGYLTINKTNASEQTVTALSDIVILKNLDIYENSGILDITNRQLNVGGNMYIRNNRISGIPTQNFITSGSIVVFDGAVSQYIYTYHENNLQFNDVVFKGVGDKTLSYSDPGNELYASPNFEINGSVTISGSVLEGNSINLYVRGNWINNGVFNHYRTVYFDGADQTISPSSFYHVNFQGSGTKTLSGNIAVSYDLYIDGTANLTAAGHDITIGRHWYNNVAGAGYTHGTGKVVFNSVNGAYIYTGTTSGSVAGKDFYAVDVDKNANYVSLQGDLYVESDLNVNSEILYTNTYDVWVGGDFNILGSYINNSNSSTLTLNASAGTHIFNPNGATLRGLNINASGTSYNQQSNFILDNEDMNINAGALNLNENQIQLNDNGRAININGGILNINAGSKVLFTESQSINLNSGELHLVGEDGKTANLENNHADNAFTISALGGSFFANYYKIQNGKVVIDGAIIDGVDNLSNGTYVEGEAGSAYINLSGVDLGTGITLTNMVFNSGPDYNISRTSGSGTVTVTDASGALAGETHDQDNGDPGNLLQWSVLSGYYWTGGAGDNNWHSSGNWSGGAVPSNSDIVYIDHSNVAGSYHINITDGDASCLRLNISDDSGVNAIHITVGSGRTLEVVEDIVIGNNTSLLQADNTALLAVGENWINEGSYIHNNSKVTFNALVGEHIISSGGTGIGNSFYDLEINAGAAVYSLDLPLSIENDLSVISGTFNLASPDNDITIGGDWLVDNVSGGVFDANSADVTFNGMSQTLRNGSFYNLIIGSSSSTTLNSNIEVEHNLVLNSGSTLDAADRNIYLRTHWQNDNGTFIQTGLGTVIFDGTVTQYVDNGSSNTNFNNITFSNSGTKILRKDISVNGDVLIIDESGVVNVDTYLITGVGSNNKFTCIEDLQIQGSNNFPAGFETIDFASSSLVRYYADINQTIFSTTYGGLSLQRLTDGATRSVKTAAGDLVIEGTLYLNSSSRPAELDMEVNDSDITLSGSIDLRGSNTISWGTGNSTIEHVGANWYIDADITNFNNVILGGTGDKYMQGNLAITGDFSIKSGVDLMMYATSGRNDYRTLTGTVSKTISMETGARIFNSRPSTAGPAIPEGFGTYDFNENSTYYLYSSGIDQTIYTGSDIAYGNLYFSSTKNITADGIANLDVDGDFYMYSSTLYDGEKDIELAGATIYLNRYSPSSNDRKVILNGTRDQRLSENDATLSMVTLPTIEFKGAGVKTIASQTTVNGNWLIDNGVGVATWVNVTFNGSSWLNNGFYRQTSRSLIFNGDIDQNIDPGVSNENNYFRSLVFNGISTKTFINNGANVNDDITINEGTVDLGTYTHYLYDELFNYDGGSLISENANLVLDGGYQNIESPDFKIKNITCGGSGIKYLFSNWIIGNDLIIEPGVRLSTRSNSIDYDINIGGDWNNQGTFYSNYSKVTFNGSVNPVKITSGDSRFYDVEFIPSAPVIYTLESETTSFYNQMDIGVNAHLDLNNKQLFLGRYNTEPTVYTINGTLTIDENAFLFVNNDGSQATIDVYGALNIIGTSSTSVASLSSRTTSIYRDKTIVNINPGATIAARYYLIQYIADQGLNLMEGSVLDPVNNFSDGAFMNIRNQQDARYLILESDYAGGSISNISFSYDQEPVQGRIYNVQRKLAGTDITFENVSGTLGSYEFEDDDQTIALDNGKLRWPEYLESNWTGAIDTDWHKDGNWDNGVPTANVNAIISDQVNDPSVFNENAICRSLEITDGSLQLKSDMNIEVNGDVLINEGVLYVNSSGSEITVKGDWRVNKYADFVHGEGTVSFISSNGTANIVPGNSGFYNINFDNALTTFNMSGSDIDIFGNLTISNGTISPATDNYTYNVYGNYEIVDGDFNVSSPNDGEIVLKADWDQTITNGVFENLVVDGGGNKLFNGGINVEGTTIINSTMTAQSGCNIVFNGDVKINTSATFNDGSESHEFKGRNWYGYGNYIGSGTIMFNRLVNDQNIYEATFNNLDIDCAGISLYIRDDVTVNGNFIARNGVVNINTLTNTITSDGTGNFTLEDDVSLYIYGQNNFPKSFSSYEFAQSSYTRYYGSIDQNVDGITYGHLVFDHNTTKTLTGNTVIKGNLYFNETTLDISESNYSVTIGGNWYNNNAAGGNFICREGEVIFNGTSVQSIYFYDENGNDFYDLTVASSARVNAYNSTNNDFVILNNLSVNTGEFYASGRTIFVGGNLIASGAGQFAASGTYYLNKPTGNASIALNGSTLYHLIIDGSATTFNVLDDINLLGSFTLTSGVFNANGKTVNLGNSSDDIITIEGTYIIGPGGVLGLGNGTSCTVEASGRIEVVGSKTALAKVTNNNSGGRYGFVVHGEIAAEYYLFEYMSNVGIYLSNTSTIDASHYFSNGTFSNGTAIGQLFRVENMQSFTEAGGNRIENVSFPINPGGSAANVAKYSANSGVLEFYNSTGVFSGENYDNDTKNLINWSGPVQLTWNGSIDTDWNNVDNWTPSSGPQIVPTAENSVFIVSALNQPIITTEGQITGNLTIENGASLRINTLSGDVVQDLNVDGDLTINGQLITNSDEDLITVEGNWTATSGSSVLLSGNVTFDGEGGAKQIDNNGSDFYSITISGTSQYQMADDLLVLGDFIIENGALFDVNPANYTLTVQGKWKNNGTFNAQQGTVVLSSLATPVSIESGGSEFYNLHLNAPGVVYSLYDNVGVDGLLYIEAGTLDLEANILSVGDGLGIDGISVSGALLVNEGATLNMGDESGINVNTGGMLELVGTDVDNRAILTSISEGRFSLDINSGGLIKANYYSIDYLDADGLYVHIGANIDEVHNLSNGVFSNGYPGSGSYLTMHNDMIAGEVNLYNLVFNSGPAYCVTRTEGNTIFKFIDASGVLGNYLFEKDEEATRSPSSGLLQWPFDKLYIWEGDEDSNWQNSGNWFDDQLPVATSDVIIPNTNNDPIIDNSQLYEMHGLNIEAGASLIVNSGANLTLNGDMSINGDMIINNNDESLVSIINKGAVSGEVTYNWLLDPIRWWYMGHPVSNVSVAEYENSVGTSVGNDYRAYIWTAGDPGSWVNVTGSNYDFTSMEAIAYQVLNNSTPLTYKGQFNNDESYSYPASVLGWHQIANPYPSFIDLNNIDFGSFTPSVYIFTTYNNIRVFAEHNPLYPEASANGGSRYVAPGQSFWVQLKAGSDPLIIKKEDCVHNYGGSLKSNMTDIEVDVLRLRLKNTTSDNETLIRFGNFGSEVLSNYDSEKRMVSGNSANLYSIKDGVYTAINSLPLLDGGEVIPLGYKVSEDGMADFTIQVNDLTAFDPAVSVYLEDIHEGVIVDLREEREYTFTPTVAHSDDRFVIRLEKISTDVHEVSCLHKDVLIYAVKDIATVKVTEQLLNTQSKYIEVYDILGQLIDYVELNAKETNFKLRNANSIYIIKVYLNGESYQQKVVCQ